MVMLQLMIMIPKFLKIQISILSCGEAKWLQSPLFKEWNRMWKFPYLQAKHSTQGLISLWSIASWEVIFEGMFCYALAY